MQITGSLESPALAPAGASAASTFAEPADLLPAVESAPEQNHAESPFRTLQDLALKNSMLPVKLVRESCSLEAEKAVRLLGRAPHVADPWLPVSTLGPLLVMVHHNPGAADMWGVPPCFVIRMVVTPEQYLNTRKDLVGRFAQMPIGQTSVFESLRPPRFNESGLLGAFRWMLGNYPFDSNDLNRMRGYLDTASQKGEDFDIPRYNSLQKHLGIVLNHLVTQGSTFVFNPADAPRQSFSPCPFWSGTTSIRVLWERGSYSC
jgi:hypothetical protein